MCLELKGGRYLYWNIVTALPTACFVIGRAYAEALIQVVRT